jgi:hypothetical protein
MCAMVCDPYGGSDVLCLRNVPLPEPQGGDVLIRVGYAGCQSSRLESTFRRPDTSPAAEDSASF